MQPACIKLTGSIHNLYMEQHPKRAVILRIPCSLFTLLLSTVVLDSNIQKEKTKRTITPKMIIIITHAMENFLFLSNGC